MTTPRRALVVIDVQNEYFEGVLAIQHPPRATALANVVRAVEAAHEHDLPVDGVVTTTGRLVRVR